MKKKINKILISLKKISKKIFTRKIILSIFLPLTVILILFLLRSQIFAAWVNGKPVFRRSLTKELEKQGGQQILDSLIEKSLIYEEASTNKIKVTQADIDVEIARIEELIKAQGLTLDEALSFRNQTRKNLVEQIKIQIIVEKVLGPKITITDQELKDYFTSNKSLFGTNPIFDKVKSEVKEQLFQQKLSQEYTEWISDLKTKAKILYFIKL